MSRTAKRLCVFTSRRATVLFAVLFLLVLASLSATTMLGAVAAERAAVGRELDELRLRAAARSALLVYKAELSRQRGAMLEGVAPTLPEEIRIEMGEGEPTLVVRLLPVSGGGGGGEGGLITPEPARLDLNHAKADMISSLPGFTSALAQRIVTERESGFFLAPADVLRVEGAGDLASPPVAGMSIESDPLDSDDAHPFDLFTVYSFEPQLQAGLGGDDHRGSPRVNINAPWSDQIERAFERHLSGQTARTATGLFIDAPTIERMSELVRLLIEKAVPQDEWPALLDALTTSPDLYVLGRVDINSAPREVLAALPGLSETLADDLVTVRQRLDITEMKSITWPLREGIITPDAFVLLVDHVVTRSLQWRVILHATFDESDDSAFLGFDPDDAMPDLLPEADEFGVAIENDESTASAEPGVIFEVVFDLAAQRPRIAYLRDRTAYGFVEQLASMPEFQSADEFNDAGSPADGSFMDDNVLPYEAAVGDHDPDARPMTLDDLTDSYFEDEDEPELDEPDGVSRFNDEPGAGDPDESAETAEPSTRPDVSPVPAPGDNRLGRWAPTRKGGRS